jgi:hypothetical protein
VVGDQVLIGYSFWGFLGAGITDTPDGGRSHRRVLIDGLRQRGHEVVFLQANRDLHEAGLDLTTSYQWDTGLPDVDALFLEWRWRIPGRNDTACGTVGHTCDLHRQRQLLNHYTATGVRTLLWDKDRRLSPDDPLRAMAHVTVCEPALHPTPGATTLLFPVADSAIDRADPAAWAAERRDLPLVYIGNQYDRDDAFNHYFAPAAAEHHHLVAGKWTRTHPWPDINFKGRVPFTDVDGLYRRAVATVLLLPNRYAKVGHMTQRLFEAVLAGCAPLTPAEIRGAAHFTTPSLHIPDGAAAAEKIRHLAEIAGTDEHTELLTANLEKLNLFRLSRQMDVIQHEITKPVRAGARR